MKKEADSDPLFRAKMESHPEKDITAVCNYIVAEVAKQVSGKGAGGFADEEIYAMAKHFIDEDDLKPEKFTGKVCIAVNSHIVNGLTDEEKAEAKKTAIAKYELQVRKEAEAAAKAKAKKEAERKKAVAEKKRQEAEEKARKLERMQPSLFGELSGCAI